MNKIIIALSAFGLAVYSVAAFSQDPGQLKEDSMQACETQAAQMPEVHRDAVLRMCKCTVDNTDFAKVIVKSAAGDPTLQSDALSVAQSCAQQ